MKNRKTIMIDMDDVITSGGFLYLINNFLNTNYVEKDFTDFYMQDIIPNKNEFFEYFLTKNMYDYCHLNGDVVNVIKDLNDQYDVYICTSYLFKEIPDRSGQILVHKFDYLIKNFPFLNPYNFVFLGDKSIVNADIRIDDKLDNLYDAKTKILYSAYHNLDISDELLAKQNVIRVNDWNDIRNILLEDKI